MNNNKRYTYGSKPKIESIQSMDFLKNVKPSYADFMYHQNRIVEAFAMSELGGVEILDMPVCKKCEKPGWNTDNPNFVSTGDPDKDRDVRNCYCVACGSTSYNTITMRQYLIEELNIQEDKIADLEDKIHGGVM